MNNQGQSQPTAMPGQAVPGAQAAGAPRPPPMYRPEMMQNLPILNDEEKVKYERGLRQLWGQYENSPEESPQHQDAKKKIIDFSKMLMGKLHARRLQAQQHAQAQQQAQQLAQQGGQAAPAPQPPQPTQAPAPAPPVQPAAQASNDGPPAAPKPSVPTAAPNNPAATATAPAAPQPGQPGGPGGVPAHIMNHVRQMTFHPSAQYLAEKGADAGPKFSQEMRGRYVKALMTMDQVTTQMKRIDAAIKDRMDKGTPYSPDEMKQLQVRKEHHQKVHAEAQRFVETFRKSQDAIIKAKNASAAASGGAIRPPQPNGAGAGASQAPGAPGNNQQAPAGSANSTAQNSQAVTATVNAAVEAAKNQQQMAAAGRGAPTSIGMPQQQPQPAPATATQLPPQQQQQQPQTHPVATSAPHPPGMRPDHPHPPPVNTAIASVAAQMPSAGTPTQNRVQTPQTTTPVGTGKALSHSAAMSLANQRVNSVPGSAATMPGQPPTGTPASAGGAINQGVMGSGVMGTAQQGHAHTHPTQPTQTLQSKLPIPKQLPEKATAVPSPVNMGGGVSAGRPTYSGGGGIAGGVMGQPAMSKIPAYHHEAEGDHVLSKKKLDELVRQVCGGSAEGQDGNLLTPEVEENVLNMADSFVDNVLHAACRNAKERGSKVLEIRDLQLVLERTYNIRVPGYSSDELRTTRKVVPSAAWITKMSAIQAAKVTSGKGE